MEELLSSGRQKAILGRNGPKNPTSSQETYLDSMEEIENERTKSCETEEEAMYVLRGINTRLNILEDYLFNTPDLSDNERKRWEFLAIKYRELRNILAKKKIMNKKQYGIFVDYNQLDQLDK